MIYVRHYLFLLRQHPVTSPYPVTSLCFFQIDSIGFCRSLQLEMSLRDALQLEDLQLNFVVCYEAPIFQ